jgi:hypothetical protein
VELPSGHLLQLAAVLSLVGVKPALYSPLGHRSILLLLLLTSFQPGGTTASSDAWPAHDKFTDHITQCCTMQGEQAGVQI